VALDEVVDRLAHVFSFALERTSPTSEIQHHTVGRRWIGPDASPRPGRTAPALTRSPGRLTATVYGRRVLRVTFSTFLSTTWPGIARAEHQGGTWEVGRVSSIDARCLAADRVTGDVYAGTHGDGVWRSHDGGRTWLQVGLNDEIVKSLATSVAAPGTLWAGTKPPHVWVSRDSGSAWQELEAFRDIPGRAMWRQPAERPSTPYVQSLTVSPTDPDVIVAGMEAGAVVRSTDGGRTWSGHRKRAFRDCHTVTFHARDGSRVYEAGGAVLHPGVALSEDAGDTWIRPADGLEENYGWAVAADADRPDVVFVSLSPGPRFAHSQNNARARIYRRVAEQPWEALTGGLPQPFDSMPYALLADPDAPGHIYAGTSDGTIFATRDLGDGWERLDLQLPAIHRTLIAY